METSTKMRTPWPKTPHPGAVPLKYGTARVDLSWIQMGMPGS